MCLAPESVQISPVFSLWPSHSYIPHSRYNNIIQVRLLSEAKPTYGVSHAELEDQLWKLEQKTEVHSKNTCNMATLAFLPAGHFSIATQNSLSLHSLLSATTESPISLP